MSAYFVFAGGGDISSWKFKSKWTTVTTALTLDSGWTLDVPYVRHHLLAFSIMCCSSYRVKWCTVYIWLDDDIWKAVNQEALTSYHHIMSTTYGPCIKRYQSMILWFHYFSFAQAVSEHLKLWYSHPGQHLCIAVWGAYQSHSIWVYSHDVVQREQWRNKRVTHHEAAEDPCLWSVHVTLWPSSPAILSDRAFERFSFGNVRRKLRTSQPVSNKL